MAIVVMLIIIVLNIALLILVMRVGTQGEHHSELAADQSAAVMTLYNRLGLSEPESHEAAVANTSEVVDEAQEPTDDSTAE